MWMNRKKSPADKKEPKETAHSFKQEVPIGFLCPKAFKRFFYSISTFLWSLSNDLALAHVYIQNTAHYDVRARTTRNI